MSVPWIFGKSGVSCIMSKGSPAERLVVQLYVVDLTCFSHTTKWRCVRGAVQRNTILFPLKAHSLWNLCKAAASVRWRCTTRHCWLNCRNTLQRNGHNFIGLDGDFIMTTHSLTSRIKSCSFWLNVTLPPYIPNLAPCDFFLFPSLKTKLRGIWFETSEAVLKKSEANIWKERGFMYNIHRWQHFPVGRLVVLLNVVDLTCYSHTTKWMWRKCTAVYYTSLLAKLRKHISNKRALLHRTARRLHHDNAQPHVANHVMQFLVKFNITSVSHPPYNPDLAPCDFFLFSSLKAKLRGIRFETCEAVLKKCEAILKDLTKNVLRHVFGEW